MLHRTLTILLFASAYSLQHSLSLSCGSIEHLHDGNSTSFEGWECQTYGKAKFDALLLLLGEALVKLRGINDQLSS